MSKAYSIAEARNQLSRVVHEAESTGEVQLTRRGKPVAVVLSMDEYRRLNGSPRECDCQVTSRPMINRASIVSLTDCF